MAGLLIAFEGLDQSGKQTQARLLADRLRRDYSDSLAKLYHPAGGEVAAVTLGAYTVIRLAGQDRSYPYPLDPGPFDAVGGVFGYLLAG